MGRIVVEGISKAYKQYPSRKHRLAEWFTPTGKTYHQKHWVLRDVDFSVDAGESVGIIGANGAGKSTLLKMITGVVSPTTGRIHVEGNVSALLELGMGFHPDFTGRQNIYLAGQLLGHTSADLDALMPSIEAFAEIGEYIDQPLRTYSSGMQMRLAFSLATATRPDLLIVDEALSVGDAYFQHKSFDRIREFKKQGTSLLIVSHNNAAIQSICDKAIMLNDGKICLQGKPDDVLDYYNAMLADKQHTLISQTPLADGSLQTTSGTNEVSITDVQLRNAKHAATDLLRVGEPSQLAVTVKANQNVDRLVLGFLIKDRFGQAIYGINTHRTGQELHQISAGDTARFVFSFPANIGKGNYSISLSASRFDSHLEKNYCWIDRAMVFHVINADKEDFVGSNWLNASITIDKQTRNTAKREQQ